MFGTVNAVEVHKNGFGGITPLNTTGLTAFNESLKRSFDFESDSLVLSAEFSILETNGDVRDFSLFDNDLTLQNTTIQEPIFVDSLFRTALETTNEGIFSLNITSTADALVDQSFPTTNYGSNVLLLVRSWSGSNNRRSFLQWDLSTIPSIATITQALMWINKIADVGAFPRTYEAQAVSASWMEGTITWNTQPGVIGSPASSVITTTDTWYAWDITTIVQNWVDGTWTNNGIRVMDSAENSGSEVQSNFDSREATDDPILDVDYTIGGQWATASHSETLDMENTNVSLVWWGQTANPGSGQITGKGCSSSNYVYGLQVQSDNTISAFVADNACSTDLIQTSLPSGGLVPNQTYSIGVVFEDNTWGTDVHFWLDGEWIYNETSTERVGDDGASFYVGRSSNTDLTAFLNGTHDEILVFQERLSNDTMKLLTTKQHDIVIKAGPRTTTQGFEGLFFALPWLIVFGLLGWLGYIIFLAWKEPFTR